MKQAKLYRYCIPINTRLTLRGHHLSERVGIFVYLSDNERIGWGEIAPLPGFSRETLNEAQKQAQEWLAHWQNDRLYPLHSCVPSVAFGLSTALMELNGKLNLNSHNIPVPLYSGDFTQFEQKLQQQQGKISAKVKIARHTPEQDGKTVANILQKYSQVQLRLDANRAWSLADAQRFSAQIAPALRQRIEFIEEPCHTPALSREFAKRENIAIAWDESVRDPNFLVRNEANLSAIILKPTLIGTIEQTISLIQQAHKQGLSAVISSSLESSLGLSQLARIATQYTPNTPAGLDTLDLMAIQLIRPYPNANIELLGLESKYIQEIQL